MDYKKLCDTAVKYGSAFHKELNFSADSIAELEKILQYYHEEYRENRAADNQLWNLSVVFGVYLGQTLLDTYLTARGYIWAPGEDSIPVLMKDGKNQMSPITKVYKRLLNGPEDNVKSFYDVALLIADGRLNLSHGDKKG